LKVGEMVALPTASSYFWEFVGTTSAVHFPSGYNALAPTEQDSVSAGHPPTVFTVVARNASYSMYWASQPDSGYSVDNLAPSVPSSFTGTTSGNATHLMWEPSPETDVAGYRLYRGSSAAFVPGPGNLLAMLAETSYDDSGPPGGYYKLSAVDVHGNESLHAFFATPPTTDAPRSGPWSTTLASPSPNPASRPVTLSYSLSRNSRVQLAIYDVAGRLARILVSGPQSAGEHRVEWDLRDGGGKRVGPGLHFVRLLADGQRRDARLVTTR
jgi:hypothetical protein